MDLVIGTHRLLSKDVKFKNLGLLVVDEEQRFGVQHKEALKMLKNVDVLTLSATPIPRTLHMSLTGIKDMSIIRAAARGTLSGADICAGAGDYALIKEIIERELSRGGQVYVVFNRVQGINKIAAEIRDIVPDARVAVGHGQMDERELEKVMLAFINGETNVLVATTIIESGIDIPNVNTMIIFKCRQAWLVTTLSAARQGRQKQQNGICLSYVSKR